MSDQIGLLLKMLLPSVAISIAIKYFSITPTPVPTAQSVLAIVLLPSMILAISFWSIATTGSK